MTDTTKHMLRAMAWERAKGELYSVLHTFIGEGAQQLDMSNAIEQFVGLVEENGWAE